MSISQLIFFAQQHGYRLTEDQIKKWKNAGIIHKPIRVSTKGSVGSKFEYSEATKQNLLLALKSSEKRSLDKMVLDVWIRGGSIEPHFLQKILEKDLKKFSIFFKAGKWTTLFKRLEPSIKKKRDFLPHVKTSDKGTTLMVMMNVISSLPADAIWNEEHLLLEDKPAAEIAHQALGIDILKQFEEEFDRKNEKPESTFQVMKEILNISSLEKAIKDSTYFKQAQQDYRILEPLLEFFEEAARVYGPSNALMRFLGWAFSDMKLKRSFAIIALLACFQDSESSNWIRYLVEKNNEKRRYLLEMTRYLRHMKQHALLKKRYNWGSYIPELAKNDPKSFESIQEHHQSFIQSNPEFLSRIE
ncbi:MAG: hypothetical protein ACXWM7_06745 [Parachlamydiaceae bacterium]